ncbi:hypothetical protein K438DRAFT_1992375 [Mycena galopus ATCC 62051]|nr:hypothetical protein K438DRAFT_2006417 [Mycena galopus ATCC 62051]KAF8144917.1 hypothetical protein K438DRAFT_1992375 [Mycena galopus ATCC 62051]
MSWPHLRHGHPPPRFPSLLHVATSSTILSILLPSILRQSHLPFILLHSITLRSRPANSTLRHRVLRAIPALVGPPPARDPTSFAITDALRALDAAYTSVSAMSMHGKLVYMSSQTESGAGSGRMGTTRRE